MGIIQVKMKPLPDYGEHMTREEFLGAVETNFFFDYDGDGQYATATEMSDVRIWPSKVRTDGSGWDERFTHIVWFNR
jgi:hypothetical protein